LTAATDAAGSIGVMLEPWADAFHAERAAR
jgi:hypothetical protein